MRRSILITLLLVFAIAPMQAQEPKISPIQIGKFYSVWFGSGETTGNMKFVKPDTSMEVLERAENWLRVRNISEPGFAKKLWGVSQVKNDTELGRQLLAGLKQDKETFIKEVEGHPMAPIIVREMWINLDQITVLEEIAYKP